MLPSFLAHPPPSLRFIRARLLLTSALLGLSAAASAPAFATGGLPPIPAATSHRYPGTITLDVDATDLDHKIMTVHESIPVRAGHLVLLYPQWIPGAHSPIGNVSMLTGLHIKAGTTELRWTRDPENMFAFHVDVPSGATALDVDFQFVSPLQQSQGRVVMNSEMLHLQFHSVVLYPAGYHADGIMVSPRVRLPAGWKQASALELADDEETGASGAALRFKAVDLTTLVDSPLMAGSRFKRFELAPDGPVAIGFNVFSEHDDGLKASDKTLAAHRALITEAGRVFGPPPFAHYDFLMGLTESIGGIGREHFQSTEIVEIPAYIADVMTSSGHSTVVPHEYVHAWVGKYRRPADQLVSNFSEPLQNSLLWVYEGQTTYYGDVLAARAGFRTQQVARDRLALSMAYSAERQGRAWRDLQDTVNDEVVSPRTMPRNWTNWQRQLDYYNEGSLIWMGIDARIRSLTGEKKSLDDFSAAFYQGGAQSLRKPKTYRFEDVAAALNGVVAYDWATLLRTRLAAHDDSALVDDLGLTGWRLVYTKTPNPEAVIAAKENGDCDAAYSLGMSVNKTDVIGAVRWNGPAFKAGLTGGTTIIAVNGRTYKCSELNDAIAANEGKTTPIEFIVKRENRVKVVPVVFAGGLRYPHLERIENLPDRLTPIFSARTAVAPPAAVPASAPAVLPAAAPAAVPTTSDGAASAPATPH
jgi:predicted metalloprotease with PDZ domain